MSDLKNTGYQTRKPTLEELQNTNEPILHPRVAGLEKRRRYEEEFTYAIFPPEGASNQKRARTKMVDELPHQDMLPAGGFILDVCKMCSHFSEVADTSTWCRGVVERQYEPCMARYSMFATRRNVEEEAHHQKNLSTTGTQHLLEKFVIAPWLDDHFGSQGGTEASNYQG